MIDPDKLNADGHAAGLDQATLEQVLRAQGDAWHNLVKERCPYLFAGMPVYISPAQLRKMYGVIAAVERVVGLAGWQAAGDEIQPKAKGVFFGYDFHLNGQGVHLIEINSNAGGAFLNELLAGSQRDTGLPGKTVAIENLEPAILAMFRNEWRLERGSAPFKTIAIVDEKPEQQYLYPEFLLAKRMLERDGLAVYIVDPVSLKTSEDGLYFGNEKIDMVYNRLTDFPLRRHPVLLNACSAGKVVLTRRIPMSLHARYADKRNLARLTDRKGWARWVRTKRTLPRCKLAFHGLSLCVSGDMESALWAERKQWFFKPKHRLRRQGRVQRRESDQGRVWRDSAGRLRRAKNGASGCACGQCRRRESPGAAQV